MFLNQSIDFESLNKFQQKNLTTIDLEFVVQIQDHGQPLLSNQMKIILRIHDLNDHAPEFDKNQTYNWTYSSTQLQSGSVLGQISAVDLDSGLQGLIYYTIRSFNPCLTLDITSLGYVYIPSESTIFTCALSSYTFEITASDYDQTTPRSTTQLLTINLQSNSTNQNHLPKLLPLSTGRTIVDINNQDNIVFILDITTLNNRTYQPKIYLNDTNLLSYWNVSPTGEVRLISHLFESSYILSLNILDEYTNEHFLVTLQVDICNSSIFNSCQTYSFSDNRRVLLHAISLALIITLTSIIIFSILICLCCRKTKHKKDVLSSTHQQSFLQCSDDYNERYKSSSNSTIREDDRMLFFSFYWIDLFFFFYSPR